MFKNFKFLFNFFLSLKLVEMKEKKEARTKEKNARGPRTAGFLYQYEESDDGSNVRTIVRVLNEQEEIEFKEEERIRKVKEDERIARQQFYASSNLILPPNTPHTQNLNQNLNSNLSLNQSSLLTSHNILQSNLSSSNLNSNLNSNLLSSNNNLSISNISNMNNSNNSRISQQQQQQQQQKSSSLSVPSSREPSPLSPGKK